MSSAVARCQTWARHYLAGLMLTAALVVAPPEGQLRTRPAIVRLVDRRSSGHFDPRELAGPDLVLTTPLTIDRSGPDAPDMGWTGLN